MKLLPKLAFFALWDTPILGTPALISEYLQDETEEDFSDGENPGGPLPGANEMPTTSPTVPFVEILSATNPATIMNDSEAPLVAIALENFLGAAAVMLRQRYQETVLSLVKQGVAEAALAEALESHLAEFQVQLAAYVAAVVVSLFDPEVLANLPAALLPFRQLADERCVHRAILRHMNYLVEMLVSTCKTPLHYEAVQQGQIPSLRLTITARVPCAGGLLMAHRSPMLRLWSPNLRRPLLSLGGRQRL